MREALFRVKKGMRLKYTFSEEQMRVEQMNYKHIQQLAGEGERDLTDLNAMAQQNNPFDAGISGDWW